MSVLVEEGESEEVLPYRHQVVALLVAQGMSQAGAARMMGFHQDQVTRWKKNKIFADFLVKAQKEFIDKVELARDILKEGAPLAALKIRELIEGEEEAIQLRAAGDILDRAGISKVSKLEAEVKGELTLYGILAEAEKDDRVKRSQED